MHAGSRRRVLDPGLPRSQAPLASGAGMTSSVGLPRIAEIPRTSPRHARQEDTALRHLAVARHAGPGGARQQAVRHAAVGERRGVLDELRPEEGGRQVILRAAAKGGQVEELLPAPFSARSRVHEYGGGEFLVAGGVIYFVNDRDQQVYAIEKGAPPRRITNAPRMRFADFAHDAARGRLIAVAEVHPAKGDAATTRNPTTCSSPLHWARRARSASWPRAATSMPVRASRPTAAGSPTSPGTCRTCHGTAPRSTWPA